MDFVRWVIGLMRRRGLSAGLFNANGVGATSNRNTSFAHTPLALRLLGLIRIPKISRAALAPVHAV